MTDQRTGTRNVAGLQAIPEKRTTGFEPATFGLGSCPRLARGRNFREMLCGQAQLREVRIAVFGTYPGHAAAPTAFGLGPKSAGCSRAAADRALGIRAGRCLAR